MDNKLMTNKGQNDNAVGEGIVSKQVEEVKGAIFLAKQFPRDMAIVETKIKTACASKALANKAQYSYPRGNTIVKGPTIRLAERLKQCCGNMSSGVAEIERMLGKSRCMAYAVDYETNTREEYIFDVPHFRDTKKGKKRLEDSRDIKEMVMNYGARYKRGCILSLIPQELIDMAVELCEKTVRGELKKETSTSKKLQKRIKDMVAAFGGLQMDSKPITAEMIESYIGKKVDQLEAKDLETLLYVYNAIKSGEHGADIYFGVPDFLKDGEQRKIDV